MDDLQLEIGGVVHSFNQDHALKVGRDAWVEEYSGYDHVLPHLESQSDKVAKLEKIFDLFEKNKAAWDAKHPKAVES